MNAIATRLVVGLIAALTAFGAWQSVHALRAELADVRRAKDSAETAADECNRTIRTLREQAAEHERQRTRLERDAKRIRVALAARQSDIDRLTHENATLRAWADRPLPDDVIRLYASPTLVGAGDYIEHLCDGGAVRAAGDGAAH
jgi:LysB family phage lysis regulatory protein